MTAGTATIQVARIERPVMNIDIVGLTPYIAHRWSEKARKMMLDNMQGIKSPKEPKDPKAEFEAAQYRFPDGGHGIPAVAFKSAIVGSARFFGKSVKMTELRQAVHVLGEGEEQLVRIVAEEPWMREDPVKVGMNGTDLRYRPQYDKWAATISVSFVPSLIDKSSIVALVDAAGMVGVGEWRPEKSGTYGTFQVAAE